MKQHKVIATIKNTIMASAFSKEIESIATYERVYPSKSAAINNMREMCNTPMMPAQTANGTSLSAKFNLSAHVMDMETGKEFNWCQNGCVDFNQIMTVEEAEHANCDKLIEMLEARGFQKVA